MQLVHSGLNRYPAILCRAFLNMFTHCGALQYKLMDSLSMYSFHCGCALPFIFSELGEFTTALTKKDIGSEQQVEMATQMILGNASIVEGPSCSILQFAKLIGCLLLLSFEAARWNCIVCRMAQHRNIVRFKKMRLE